MTIFLTQITDQKRDEDPKAIFAHACSFYSAFLHLTDGLTYIDEQKEVLQPAIVNSAFASELFLKCLLKLAGCKVEWEHDLHALFNDLSEQHRKALISIWNVDVVPMRKGYWDHVEEVSGKPVARDLETSLTLAKKAFQKIRYSYEGLPDGFDFFLMDLPAVAFKVIVSIRPEWARDFPNRQFRKKKTRVTVVFSGVGHSNKESDTKS